MIVAPSSTGCGWGGFPLLTRQMEWVTGGNGDEKAVLRFMNKCKHIGTQLLRLVISVRLRRGVNVQRHPRRFNLMETRRLLGRLIVYT